MINIKKLIKPMRKSGYALESGEATQVRGMVITNTNSFTVYIDKWSKKKPRKKK